MSFFSWLFGGGDDAVQDDGYDPNEHACALRSAYWKADADEAAALQAKIGAGISQAETLRLLHLTCMGLLETPEGQATLQSGDPDEAIIAPDGEHIHLLRAINEMWLETNNPYRGRCLAVWQTGNDPDTTGPDWVGMTINSSLTHFGALEAITLEEQADGFHATGLEFVPFSEIHQLTIMAPATFSPAKLFLGGDVEKSVLVPLLYHWSESTPTKPIGTAARRGTVASWKGWTNSRRIGASPSASRNGFSWGRAERT